MDRVHRQGGIDRFIGRRPIAAFGPGGTREPELCHALDESLHSWMGSLSESRWPREIDDPPHF
jgi:hypothetical protein